MDNPPTPDLPLPLQESARELAAAIEDELVIETEGWAPRMLTSAHRRFADAGVPLSIESCVVWAPSPAAVTLVDGRTYLSREILSRGVSEGGVAFVLAHEQAHHDLRHFDAIARWADRVDGIPGALWLGWAFIELRKRSQRDELAADALAFARCRRAGYALDDALSFFRVLERYYLEHRALRAVWKGPLASSSTHPPVETRIAALLELAERPDDELPAIPVRAHLNSEVPYRRASPPVRVHRADRFRDRMAVTIEHARRQRERLENRARRRRAALGVLSALAVVLAIAATAGFIANPQAWIAGAAFTAAVAAITLGTVALGARIEPRPGDAPPVNTYGANDL